MRSALTLLLALSGCVEPAAPLTCLDADQDGVCDRERADWSSSATLPAEGHRANIYELAPDDLLAARSEGLGIAHAWPVSVSGLLLPYGPMDRFFTDEPRDATHAGSLAFAQQVLGFSTLPEMADWLGLAPWPTEEDLGFPLPDGVTPGEPMGMGRVHTPAGDALTFSCAACHTTSLFGTTVVGLTNRRTRANEFFVLAQSFFPALDPELLRTLTDADDNELKLFIRAQQHLPAIGAVRPVAQGLDTSLAQVGLSLSRRDEDPLATRDPALELSPRPNALSSFVADSKPAVWWTLKYKTSWLSDGSIVSGNPVHTNFLWNEIGRGTDLEPLAEWMDKQARDVDVLTAAVFATEPPRWVDILGEEGLDLVAAQRGATAYAERCAACHGSYTKGWDDPSLSGASLRERAATLSLDFEPGLGALDVGTDPQRAEGMSYFAADLNRLDISHKVGVVVEVQPGYLAPPLDGIWSRFPYLHNASVPSLCALLSPEDERPAVFYNGPPDDPDLDFDADCVGLPVGDATPSDWLSVARYRIDTTRPGLSNRGHAEAFTGIEGEWLIGADERSDLIAFLKTL